MKINLAATIRHLILEGKSNAEIISALKLPAAKRHYPSWYRCELMR